MGEVQLKVEVEYCSTSNQILLGRRSLLDWYIGSLRYVSFYNDSDPNRERAQNSSAKTLRHLFCQFLTNAEITESIILKKELLKCG